MHRCALFSRKSLPLCTLFLAGLTLLLCGEVIGGDAGQAVDEYGQQSFSVPQQQDIQKYYDKANKLQAMTKGKILNLNNAGGGAVVDAGDGTKDDGKKDGGKKDGGGKKGGGGGGGGVHTVKVNWFANNTRIWFKHDLPGGAKEFIVIDAEKGTRGPAFDHKKLATSLSKAANATYAAEKLPFNAIKFVDDQKAVEFDVAAIKWKCNLTEYDCVKVGKAEVKKDEPPPDKKKIDDIDDDLDAPWDIMEEPGD